MTTSRSTNKIRVGPLHQKAGSALVHIHLLRPRRSATQNIAAPAVVVVVPMDATLSLLTSRLYLVQPGVNSVTKMRDSALAIVESAFKVKPEFFWNNRREAVMGLISHRTWEGLRQNLMRKPTNHILIHPLRRWVGDASKIIENAIRERPPSRVALLGKPLILVTASGIVQIAIIFASAGAKRFPTGHQRLRLTLNWLTKAHHHTLMTLVPLPL